MVQPTEMLVPPGLGGPGQPPGAGGDVTVPTLFTAALLKAGRDGCVCPCCVAVQKLADMIVDRADNPFPDAAPSSDGAAPTAEAPPVADPPPAAPPPAAPAGPDKVAYSQQRDA